MKNFGGIVMKKSITPYKIVMCCLVILLSMTIVISLIIARNANSTMYSINLTTEKTDGWVALNSPTTEDLRDIVFVDNKTGWIVGTSGTILHTTDGFNWSIQASGTSNDLETVDFINNTFGWAMGSDYIKTTDGGNTWIVKSTLNAPYPNEIDLYNETLGFGGGIGAIFQMKDGKNWVMTPYTGSIFESVQAYNDKVCWIGGYNASESANTIYGVILKTIDGGFNWQKITLPVPYIIDFDFIDLNNGWLVAADSTPGYAWGLYKTTNGGLTWTLVHRFSTAEPELIDFVNLNVKSFIDLASEFLNKPNLTCERIYTEELSEKLSDITFGEIKNESKRLSKL